MINKLSIAGNSRKVRPKILVILGPTGSGKSELAIQMAKKFNGEVISADSRQVYRELNIGTGKIPCERCQVPGVRCQVNKYYYKGIRHHLIDVASVKKVFSVAVYKRMAEKAIKDIWRRGRLPIICGGTGLYIDTLLGERTFPEVKPNPLLRRKLERKTTEELFRGLKKLDPRRAENIDQHNRRRLVRAIEIAIQTGKSSYSSVLENIRIDKYQALKIGLKIDGRKLKNIIRKRLMEWLRRGLVIEVQGLKKSGVSEKRLKEIGMEYPIVNLFLEEKISREEMIEKSVVEIWRYAKRQMTWFRRDKNIVWISRKSEVEKLVRKLLDD